MVYRGNCAFPQYIKLNETYGKAGLASKDIECIDLKGVACLLSGVFFYRMVTYVLI